MATSQPTTCPKCGQSDRTAQAGRAGIAAPPPPATTLLTITKVIRWIFGVAFGLAVLMLLAFFFVSLLLTGGAAFLGQPSDPYAGGWLGLTLIPLLCGGFAIVLLLVLMGGLTIGLPWLIQRLVKQNYAQKLSQWQRAVRKYEGLTYCTRCAGAFLPGQERLIPVENLQAFLYEIQTTTGLPGL